MVSHVVTLKLVLKDSSAAPSSQSIVGNAEGVNDGKILGAVLGMKLGNVEGVNDGKK